MFYLQAIILMTKGMVEEINHEHKHNINIVYMETHLENQQEMILFWLFLCMGMITNRGYKLPNEDCYILSPCLHFTKCILALRQYPFPMDSDGCPKWHPFFNSL
jgi:hypothetical protein